MARYTGAVCRLCRREGHKLFLKGGRCYNGKCSLDLRKTVPGQHGQGRKKVSDYGIQLRAKQMAKRYYGEKRLWPYIVKYNNMKDYNNLAIGQTINIPILK